MTDTVYRFLPWARRGLAAALPGRAEADPLPQRGVIAVEVVVAGLEHPATPSTTLHGPGDVIGLDASTIVRAFPRHGSSNAEPNYLVAVDFDPPDLPWVFTPVGPSGSDRLPPWLVLIVVEDRPGVSITVPRGAPLPQLHIANDAAAELPDLAESWAWAHVQLLVGEDGIDVPGELRDHPERNVSRLVAPRRLRPDARWHACLVPAFDAGVVRGLGGAPVPDRPLGPAWTTPDEIILPLYFHWSFGTGPAGDFESLARLIQPHKASGDVGRMRMHIGASSPAVMLPEGDPARFLDMDGALRAPAQTDGTLSQVPDRMVNGLRRVAEIVADAADGTIGDGHDLGPTDQPLGPPIYASHHARRMRLDATAPMWLRELNLDPRCRVAAGLGAEVVRENQEEFVHAAWEQVGAVIAANALLSRARLSLEAARRFHARHLRPLPADRILQLAAPMSGRTRLGATTVRAAVRPTSLPDGMLDPALRRLTAPTSRLVSRVAKRVGVETRSRMVQRFAPGHDRVDPTRFAQPALDGFTHEAPPVIDGRVDLGTIGLPVAVEADVAAALFERSKVLRAAPVLADRMALRDDLSAVGLVGETHIRSARKLSLGQARRGPWSDALSTIVATARDGSPPANHEPPSESLEFGLLIPHLPPRQPQPQPQPSPPQKSILWRIPKPQPQPQPPGPALIQSERVDLRRIPRPQPVDPPHPPEPETSMPPLITDIEVLARYREALADVRAGTNLDETEPTSTLVPYDLAAAGEALLTRCDPAVANPARVAAMVKLGGAAVSRSDRRPRGWRVAPLLDRAMAYPAFDVPAYEYLARYDRTRFVPGVDSIPNDSITLLETNPRFVTAFLAGMNHEMGRELLWRGYPTDGRGSPFRQFWGRLDGSRDIEEMHRWGPRTLSGLTIDGKAKLVLLLRGELLRRYPNTMVLARRAIDPRTPSLRDEDLREPIFAGMFEPDVSFFGFDLEDHQLTEGEGWFFGLVEPITEPRFGFDETADRQRGQIDDWQEVAWSDVGTAPGGPLRVADLNQPKPKNWRLAAPGDAAAVATALFQQPFELIVHAKHLIEVI